MSAHDMVKLGRWRGEIWQAADRAHLTHARRKDGGRYRQDCAPLCTMVTLFLPCSSAKSTAADMRRSVPSLDTGFTPNPDDSGKRICVEERRTDARRRLRRSTFNAEAAETARFLSKASTWASVACLFEAFWEILLQQLCELGVVLGASLEFNALRSAAVTVLSARGGGARGTTAHGRLLVCQAHSVNVLAVLAEDDHVDGGRILDR